MFSERLKSLRKEAKLTQKEISNIFNTTQQSYSQWESGKRKPSQETLEKFANYYNVSIDYLTGKSDIKNPAIIDEKRLDQAIVKILGSEQIISKKQRENIKNIITTYLSN
ncbi:helix-turn-helix domain-containing protein [Streptococcus sp. S784/96/1]|uniref:helix-turn-helix domain-containing protein n=1 Tax=Streptococcus sp. S784/96/1 TaxID=2653499 RepID=UPI0013872FB0|nr:helix-turn-helix transcriptional regulator [Streptococcus sp. S784/96/1]